MNKFKILVAGAAIALTSSVATWAADDGATVYATPGTAINAGTNYAIIPVISALMPTTQQGGVPTVNYLNVSGFSANPITLTSYVSTNQSPEALTNSTTTLYVNSTNGFTPGAYVVIQHTVAHPLKRFSCEAGIISTVQNTNQIVLVSAPLNAVLPGDAVNEETSWATIPIVSSSTTPTSIVGAGILTGQRNEPFLTVVSSAGVGTNSINAENVLFNP